MYNSYGLESQGTAVVGAAAPTIVAKRRLLDDKFPYLAFAIDTHGLPFYEVLLATNNQSLTAEVLADPAVRDRQPEDGFYTSRKDSGLIGHEAENYSVPPSVLQRFAKAKAIYYTVIAFRGRDMTGAVPAASAEMLQRDCPSVSITAGFTGATLGAILSVPLHRLQHVPFTTPAWSLGSGIATRDPNDLAGGEDGYGLTHAADAGEGEGDEDEDANVVGYGLALEAADELAGASAAFQGEGEGDEYDDGFGASEAYAADDDDEIHPAYEDVASALADEEDASDIGAPAAAAQAFDSTFDPGARMPGMLQDADHEQADAPRGAYEDEGGEGVAQAYDDGFGAPAPAAPVAAQPFGIAERRQIIDTVTRIGNAPPNPYAAIDPTIVAADGKTRAGIAFGNCLYKLDTGDIGRLLTLMKQRHPAKFAEVFGPYSEDLLRVTNAVGPGATESPDGRGVRLQPVGGRDLWDPSWVQRFAESARPDLFGSGQPQLFNGAQNELASQLFLDPMLPLARWLGVTTDRAIGLLFDLASRIGALQATRWIMMTIGPIQSPAQRQQALSTLGYEGLRDFQAAHPGTETQGVWGPKTHAAIAAGLWELGPRSPLPIPTTTQLLDGLVRGAPPEWKVRAQAIMQSTAFKDVTYQI